MFGNLDKSILVLFFTGFASLIVGGIEISSSPGISLGYVWDQCQGWLDLGCLALLSLRVMQRLGAAASRSAPMGECPATIFPGLFCYLRAENSQFDLCQAAFQQVAGQV